MHPEHQILEEVGADAGAGKVVLVVLVLTRRVVLVLELLLLVLVVPLFVLLGETLGFDLDLVRRWNMLLLLLVLLFTITTITIYEESYAASIHYFYLKNLKFNRRREKKYQH